MRMLNMQEMRNIQDRIVGRLRQIPHERNHGIFAALYVFAQRAFTFPSVLVISIAICGLIGAAVLGPIVATGVFVALVGFCAISAVRHYKKAKEKAKVQKELAILNQEHNEDLDELAQLVTKASNLKSKLSERDSSRDETFFGDLFQRSKYKVELEQAAAQKAREEELAGQEVQETVQENPSSKLAQASTKFKHLIDMIGQHCKRFISAHPKKILAVKAALQLVLGVITAMGILGTLGVILGGVTAIALIATPIGAIVFVATALLFTSLNLAVLHFVREKLNNSHALVENILTESKDYSQKIDTETKIYKAYIAELEEALGLDEEPAEGIDNEPTTVAVDSPIVRQRHLQRERVSAESGQTSWVPAPMVDVDSFRP